MIKVSELLVEVSKVATNNPNVKYRTRVKDFDPEYATTYCRYQVAGNPACLIGVAMSNLGISIDLLTQMDGAFECGISAVIHYFTDVFEIDDKQAVKDLLTIQNCQDLNYTWGDSIEAIR